MGNDWLRLRLRSEGAGINAEAVIDALRATISALTEIDKERSRFGSETVEWRISNAGQNSPFFAEIIGRETESDDDQASGVFDDFTNGLKHLQHHNTCPANFNDVSLRHVYDLAKVTPRGVAVIEFETATDAIQATSDTTLHAKQAIDLLVLDQSKQGKTYREFGTIEGRIKEVAEISSQKRDRFRIVDSLTQHETTCYFVGDALESKVREYWKHRVAVSGEITVRRDTGIRESMKVTEIRRLRERQELPNLGDIGPIDITNGIESSDYVRGLRDAE